MSIQNINVPNGISLIQVNTLTLNPKVLLLPTASTNQGRYLLVKDAYGNAGINNIQISTTGLDLIDGVRNRYPFSTSWGTMSLVADGNLAWRVSGMYLGQLTPASGGGPLYAFTSITFTNATATGRFGPTLGQCTTEYSGTNPWVTNTAYFNMSNQGIQLWTVPQTTNYLITCAGAKGGNGSAGQGGLAAIMIGTFALTGGDILKIMVGQMGENGTNQGGGGGGSFMTTILNSPLICAGGGGGGELQAHSLSVLKGGTTATTGNAGTNGLSNVTTSVGGINGGGGGTSFQLPTQSAAGGGGLLSNGSNAGGSPAAQGGLAFVNGGTGGLFNGGGAGSGGFGGGGGADWYSWTGAGGAGGYSGGGGGTYYGVGGGGGSYNIGLSQTNTGSNNAAMGYVTVTRL